MVQRRICEESHMAGIETSNDVHFELRPHHLLCILTFLGEGHSGTFVEKFRNIVDAINDDYRGVRIVEGPDEICKALDACDPKYDCGSNRLSERDVIALEEINGTLGLGRRVGYGSTFELTEDVINRLRILFKQEKIRGACQLCEWKELCDRIQAEEFYLAYLKG